jgi:hypothetical protein
VWRNSIEGGNSLSNETASPGIVDPADYTAWRANFGATNPGRSSIVAATVPEPTGLVLFATVFGPLVVRSSSRRVALRISGRFLQEYLLG